MDNRCSICQKELKDSEFDVCKDCEHKYGIDTEVSHEQMRKHTKKDKRKD